MAKLIHILASFFFKKLLGRFILILVALLVAAWFRAEWARLENNKSRVLAGEAEIEAARAGVDELRGQIGQHEQEWNRVREAAEAILQGQIDVIESQLNKLAPQLATALKELASVQGEILSERKVIAKLEKLRDDARSEIQWHDRRYIIGDWNPKSQFRVRKLELAEGSLRLAKERFADLQSKKAKLQEMTSDSRIQNLKRQLLEKNGALREIKSTMSKQEKQKRAELAQKERMLRTTEDTQKAMREAIENDPRQRAIKAVKRWTPTALWILLAVTVSPLILKAFCYHVIAPLVGFAKPTIIFSNAASSKTPTARPSSVSMGFDLKQNEEMLLHPDFLQACSLNARKRTKLFMNARLPLSSIASGMWMLTRIRSTTSDATNVVVSSQKDTLAEIGCVDVAAGSAIVMHPRSLVGIIAPIGAPVKISRHWRLWNLHSWITFQLRYLVFHGECKLILKGCRGIRVEEPTKNEPRIINQCITMGFSANLAYSNTRCETFLSYMLGKDDLFQDLFTGENGVYVYEEIADGGRRGGITGRWFEGTFDLVLKGFGL